MSAHAHSENTSKILMIAANPAVSGTTGWPIGFWAAELTHPYLEFASAGYGIDIASPDGGDLQIDGFSDPRHESGYSADDFVSLGFLTSEKHAALLQNTPAIDTIDAKQYDAVFLVGGQSPMVTFRGNQKLQNYIASYYEGGGLLVIVCHGTCALLETKLSNGSLLVQGKTWTGFANSEEQIADQAVGQRIQPFWIEDEAKKLPDTNFIVAGPFVSFAHRDGRLITGQQQNSGAAAARLAVEALGK